MLKKFIQTALLLVVLFTTVHSYAQVSQAPDGIQFQALATDANGHPAAGRVIYVKDAIVAKTATGTIVYSETFKVTASSAGIFTIVLGKGTYASGVTSIANIDWANGPFFLNLKIAVEPTVPTASWNVNNEYVDLGTSQFWSVPYALYAGNVKGADAKLNISDTAAMLKPYFTAINLKANIESPTFTGTVKGITKAMVGLGNVDNTSDIDKPVSTATKSALDLKANATDVNTALALKANAADVATALDSKVDKVTGKALSTNDYTTAEKTKLAAITGTNTGDQDLSALAVAADVNAALALKANGADVTTSLATKVDKVTGKELSTNDYTTAEKTKLAAITGTNTGDQVNIIGNAATATKLQSAVTINGVAFDGSSNVTIPAIGAVPYTGATRAVNLGPFDLTVNGLTIGLGAGSIGSNTSIGNEALLSNTSGYANTATGVRALRNNTTGFDNTANGIDALKSNTTGSRNSAIGLGALNSNTTGSNNLASGGAALFKNTTGNNNTSSGIDALFNNTTGSGNTAIGYLANVNSTSGSNNTVIGISAGVENTTGNNNTAIGGSANFGANNLINATAIGYGAIASASNSMQLGNTSLANVKTSGTITAGSITYPNTAGSNGYYLKTDGNGTASWAAVNGGATSVGAISNSSTANGGSISSGVLNLAPADANNGGVVTTSSQAFAGTKTFNKDIVVNSVVIGKGGNTQADNIAIGNGARSGNINTGGNANIAIGTDAQKNNTGFYNVSIGNANLVNGSGDENTALGYTVMANNTTGMRNTGVGLFSFYQNTTGNYNTAIGHSSLGVNTTGNYNTAIGTSADVVTNNLTNATAIGYNAKVASSNTMQLGNTSLANVKTSGTITAGSITYPNIDGSAGYYLKTDGNGTASWAAVSGGASSVGSILTSSVVNGASIASGVLNLAPADASNGGVVTAGSQTFGGAKTFNSNLNVNGLSIGRGNGNNDESVAIGQGAMGASNINGKRNTAVGAGAMQSYNGTSWDNNTSIGYRNMPSLTTGEGNTSVGAESMLSLLTGSQNTSVGNQSLINVLGDNNVGVGKRSGQTITTGSRNTIVGTDADVSVNNLTNATAIGYGANVTASNSIQLGNASVSNVKTNGTITAGAVTYPNTHGTSGQVLTTSGNGTLTWASTGVKNTYYGIYNALNASNSGGVFYTEHGGHPFFPENLPDGFKCTIIMYSNYAWSSNTLTSAKFFSKIRGWDSGNGGRATFSMPTGGVVEVSVVTINGQKCYFVSGDVTATN